MDRKDYMTAKQKADIAAKQGKAKTFPRTHQNMIAATGVARPGKTAKDRAGGRKA